MTGPLRIVVAEDSALMREGLCRLLGEQGLCVVASVADLPGLLDAVRELRPNVVVTDIRMPPTNTDEGLRAAETIHRDHPSVGVLVLSHYLESRHAVTLMTSSPRGVGYLLKERVGDIREVVSAIERVAAGGTAVDPEVVRELLARKRLAAVFDGLSDREREVLEMMAAGRTNAAMCGLLSVGPKTVETYVRNVFMKLGLHPAPDDHRRVLAVLKFLRGPGADQLPTR